MVKGVTGFMNGEFMPQIVPKGKGQKEDQLILSGLE
jgi:hypothetical protein